MIAQIWEDVLTENKDQENTNEAGNTKKKV